MMAPSDGASSISVTVRVRPFTIREAAQLTKCDDGPLFLGDGSLAAVPTPKLSQKGIRPVIKVVDDKALVFDPPEDSPVQRFSKSVLPQGKRVKDQTFVFDKVFDENVSQGDVYEATTRNLLDSVLDGYNATVFAYGATGCGKTHTITGTTQQPGIIFLTMQELFERISDVQGDKVTEISLSYLEIYNETIRDLLEPATDGKKGGLMLREDANEAVSVAGLSSHHPQNVQQVMDMIVRGNELRTMSPTEANATSSRSHAVLQINVSQKDRNADVHEPHTMATLSIIDLAGSERASATKNRGDRLLEGANINKSLLALGSCINALCDPRKRSHVPYRNSKLTRLLKFSLGGNCKTVMIVCVSPSSSHFDETQNTLRYANRAKNIQTKVTRNVYNVNRHVKDFLKKIDEQMNLINELKQQQKDSENLAFVKFRKLSEKREAVMKEGIGRLRSAYEHSLNERQERMGCMKKLRQIERRIAMLSAWLAAFDGVCETREDEEPPHNLVAMKKSAQGVLVELEGSRQHYHQKLSKGNWQRAVDTALQMGLKQLQEVDSVKDGSEMTSLAREAELLKATAERELQSAVADQEKGFDAALMQVLLQAHFETAAIINQLLLMEESEAVQAAKGVLGKMLTSCTEATSHVIKPDGSLPVVEAFPPTRLGTPRKRKNVNLLGPSPLQPMLNPAVAELRQASSSPVRRSPMRRKIGTVKMGLSVTPRRRSPSKRAVRWRDDTENGALAEYDRTPQPLVSTPDITGDASSITVSSAVAEESDFYSSSPIAPPPETSVDLKPKSDRFQTGFLTRKSLGSPIAPVQNSSLAAPSPLSELTVNKASGRQSTDTMSKLSDQIQSMEMNRNSSDSERSWTGDREDALKIKNAIKQTSISRSQSQRDPNRPRRPPLTTSTTTGSPPGENSLFTASHARRLTKSDKESEWRPNGMSPRTTPVVKAFAPSARRTTVSDERGFARPSSRVVSGSRLSTAGTVHASGRGSIAGGAKTMWRG